MSNNMDGGERVKEEEKQVEYVETEAGKEEPTLTLKRANTHSKENRYPPCGVPLGEPLAVTPEWEPTPQDPTSGFRDVKSKRKQQPVAVLLQPGPATCGSDASERETDLCQCDYLVNQQPYMF
ncbi:hypothetical protein Pcinc_033980 [Petrolisthes cinctipes]|uniref:Uncharacterized protein n=1 Tax=Petrolisthes cinctipes TaxID=88211 RepID=A0AAE1ER50_PETCI|nr:hypothetical protein Pcinc_033980 [Petrolisthes cinctipes]